MISTLTLQFFKRQVLYNFHIRQYVPVTMYEPLFNDAPLRGAVTTLPKQNPYTLLTPIMISLTKPYLHPYPQIPFKLTDKTSNVN